MNDFEFFSKAQDDEEENNQNAATTQGEEETTAPQKTASDFDFFSSIGHQEKPKEEYGALDSQRDKLQAELGDDPDVQTRAGAAFVNMMPFAATLSKENRDIRLKGLEALRSKSKMKEIDEMRKRNEKPVVPHKRSKSSFMKFLEYGAMVAGARNGMPMMPMPDGEAAPVFSGDTRARLKAHDAEVKKRMEGSAEDAYFAQLRDFAIKEAELKEAEVDKLRKESKTVDEFADKLSVAATDALTRFATAKKNAAKRLEKADLPWYKEAASGFMSNAGYTGQFIAASGLHYAGLGFLAAAGASQRFGELTTKEYDVDDDGRLVVLHNEDNGGAGTVAKAVAGGAAEVAVEQYLEKGLGLLFNGVRRIPGVGTAIGKAGDLIAGAVGKATGAIGAKMSRNAAGKWVVGAAKGFGKYSEITGVQGMPTEMLEEHVQSFADDVLGFDKKSRDQKGFGAEASDWWKNKFWNKKSNREIFLGLIGTMAVQGTYAGVKAHHDIAKWRQNPAGYLKTMIDEKTVDSLSDDEVAHLFKFVSSPRFTKENVERFLGHVKDRVEMSNALLQLKEANAPFFETDGGALDEAISSGAIKSQYVPPTRSVMEGARQLDWQPYTMKDGRRTMRLYDPNTGIAIDAIGGDKNNVVVTNRDGQRFDVGSMENAMNVADRLSISNQLLDAKRPMKDAYVRKRIQEVFPGGDFVILKNAAEMNKMFPDISKDRDYDPTNPAFTKDGKVYLVLDNMRNAYEVNRMILHEAAIHTGLNKKFTTDEKRDFLRNISDPETVKLMRKLGAIRGKESIDDLSDADVEEAFAHVWDRRRANPLFTQKVTHALREMGRSVGLPIDYNTDDLEVMVDTLQREGRRGSGSVSPSSDFDTASHTDSVPYNEAQRDYSGDVADIGKPSEETDDMAAIRQMQRIDRIKQNHPRMWSYAMRVNDNDEDAAADFVAKALEEEGKHGVRGEAEHGMHALEVAEKLENGEDLTPDDIEILDEHGFTGPILYSDYGYRKQKNGVWKLEVIPEKPQTPKTKQEKPNETGTRTDETPVQQKQGDAGRSAAAEAARPAESQPARTEAPGVVKEPAQASASERTVIERMTDDAPVEELPVAEVANDDSRIPNFKEGADPETGEVEPLKGGSGEIGQTQLDLGDTNGDLFNPVVRNESAKPKGDFAQQITDAIDVDAKDGLIKVVPDARFGEGAHVALYAQGSESEIKAAADSLRTAFPDAKILTDENSVVVVPASGASQGAAKPNDDTIDLSDSLGDLGAMWFNREQDEHTDEERQAHNIVLGVKIIKNFAAKGGKDFGQFARSVKAVAPEVYGRIRNQMPGMWLNAWMGGEKALVVPQADEYEGILAATDAWKAPEKPKSTPQKPQEREEAAGQDKDTPKHKTRGEAISAAADEMIDLIRVDATQRKLTRKDLENVVAKHLGGSVAEGTFEMKDVTDIMELAVNRILSGDMFAPTDKPIQKIALIRSVLNKIPTQTTRSVEQDKMQQFSTVPHEAFVAAWVANITDKDVMLEPSAGIGGIAVFAKNAGAEVILNELSPRRREILEQLGLSPKVYDFNAEHLWAQFYSPVKKGEVKRPTVVVMNPPFSNSALTSKKDTVGVGGKHIEEALEMLAPGGRLVAIVGHGMTHNADSPKVKAWWKKIGAKYRVRADVTVNGDEYAKYGTTYDNDILVIDKVAPDNTIAPIFGKIQSIDELPAMLEGVRNDRPAIQSENVAPKPDNGGPVKGTPGGAAAGQRNDGGRNNLPTGNGGNGGNKPRGKSPGVVDGGVSGSEKDVRQEHRAGAVRDVGGVVPDSAGLTEVRTAQGDSVEASPRELGDGTFSAYRPAKVRIEGAKPHPTALVESTAMASVLPPDPTYSPILPKKAIESGMPSDAQLEQIVYAGQAHEQKLPDGRRKGYFFGDGTGVGKGTEIGGVISDNWNHGRRKAVWVSKESGLFQDAMRDLVTYGLDGQIFDFDPSKKTSTSRGTGIAFLTYKTLGQDCVFGTDGKVRSAKQGKRNRFEQLVEWLGKDFDGVIVFDEAHKAGNAVPTRGSRGMKPASKQALAVVALQDALPNARILYVSATGATEVSNLSYATRLGLWGKGTAFRDRADFINRVSAGGLSVMEIVARDMKSMGVYMARSLSYDGIVNRKLEHSLSPDQKRKYDEMADAWQMVMARVGDALVTTGGVGNGNAVSAVMSALWGGQQRFFNQLLTAMQMPSVIADAKKQLDEGNSVVFQLVNTNEATQKRAIEAQRQQNGEVNADELDLSPRDILVGFVRNSFPVVKYVEQEDDEGNKEWVVLTGPNGQPVEDPIALEARQELLDKLNMMKLDDNPLELIIEEFGAENVAEITGRSQRRQMVRNDDGEMEMKLVRRSKKMGLIETDEFNAGKRRVLMFSDAGGTGRSFHADKRFGNQQKRIHYLVQAGWRADAALQGFGRTHRSNEAQPPEYVLCSTDIRGHQRFISTVARRLAQLGSLTAGDRASAGSGVFSDEDNLENQYAENAVKDLFHSIHREDFGRFNTICKQLGFVKMKLDKRTGEVNEVNDLIDPEDGTINDEKLSIQKFLNRILNCRVDVQNRLFDEFAEIMHDHIEQAKENGTFDPGLERLQGHKIEETSRTELWSGGKGTGSTDIVEIGVSNRTRKVDYETVLARMQRQAEGRNWFFARNTNSGKLFGFAETPRAKTLPSGLVVNQLRCYTPDGKAPLVLETDVRFDGDHANFEMVSEKEAAEEWGKALAAIPDMNTTKRYFVSGTLLPIWDRLAVQNPRIFRVAPTGGQSSFLGMEVKAENVNDVLRRFGKAAQSVELTPEAVLNRIVQDGKKVPLVQTGWELKRARVNGDYRIELVGPEDKKTLEKLARDGLGTYERIGYVPRFFVPRTEDGLSRFLSEYPAMPEDGGISTVAGSGADYSALDYEQRQSKFTELFNGYQNALSGNGGHAEIVKARDALDGLIAAMPTEELMNIVEEWQQYDTRRAADPVHIMRKMVRIELQKRGAIDDKQITELGLWFNRDIDALTDPLSSVAIHEVNEWRKARGLPEMPKSKRTPVEKIVKAGKYMASNADEMRRFIEVSARTPQNWTAVEVNAVAQRRIALEQDYDEKTRLINVAEMNGNKDEAQRIREARNLVQDQIDLMDSAINKAKREWGLAGLARRFMLNRDGTFARFTGEMRSIVGRELTDEEKHGAWTLWNAYRDAQGKLDEATVTKTAELLKDIVAKHMAAEEERHRKGDGKSLAEIEREYLYALDHIRVHANRAGGVLVGLPNGRKWLDAIRRYHMARAIETGRKLTVDEMLAAIHEDIDGMVVADDHDIMQMTTGHGNTYEADDSELEKALREQRRLMNEYQKWEDMMTEGHLPDKTGLIRDEPTQAEREAQRTTREMMREFMQQHPELLAMDASKRLKTIQDSLMKRWQNEIDDLQRAIEDGERIMRQKNTMTYTPEMEVKRRELEQKRQEYREAFPPEPLTHEQKVARIMRVLQARLAKLEEKRDALTNAGTDAEREALLSKAKIDKVEDIRLDDLRNQIDEVKEDIEDLKTMHFPEGTPEEFTAMVARRRKALDKNIQRIQILLANRDFAPQKREPSALAKRVAADPEIQALVKTRNAASKRLMEERERFRRSVLPYNAGRVLDWFNVLTSAPRVLRTMLDLSATMTQGAALFTSHPLMGYRALVDSVKAFASEKNTDDIMAAMEADPDYAEFQLMGGHVYTVSDISERGVPEEFRGIATKLVKVNGKEYGLDDIPGVKASERSFGVFLNSINLSVYKAIKASGGWGPTGPTDTQKKDIALSLNVASGRGYENKGARGIWERLASAALWAPRFAISGAKMAIGWNIFAPHWTGLTTERSYKDRMVSSKVAAQQYVRQMASMAAWTLLGTLLMGRKDPEWLEEVLDPRSSNFLNVRVGNTNMNFFGPIKQWWTFMARVLTGQTRGADGMVRKRDRMQTASTFVRGKLSPLAGLGVDLLNQKDFLGNKIVWDKEAGHKEISGWKHVAESLVMPLSSSDLVDAFKENSLANALMLTPFIVAGAGKSTYALDEYARVVSPYKAALKEYKAAMKEGRWADSKQILADNPALKRSASIDNLLKNVAMTKKYIENLEKAGKKPSEDLLSRYERQQQAVMEAIRK